MPAFNVVDEAADMVAMRQELVCPDARDRRADRVIHVIEAAELICWNVAGIGSDFIVEDAFIQSVQPAERVMHEDNFAGAKHALRDHERAQHIVIHEAASVAQDVRFARVQAENSKVVDAGIHAGHNGNVPCRDDGAGPLEIGFMLGGVTDEIVNFGRHEASLLAAEAKKPLARARTTCELRPVVGLNGMLAVSSISSVLASLRDAHDVSCLAYILRSGPMLDALEDAARHGARVSVRLEGEPYNDSSGGIARVNAAAIAALRAVGADAQLTHTDPTQPAQHAKAMIVDGRLFLDETNWSGSNCQTVVCDTSTRDARMVRDAATGKEDDATRSFAIRKRDAIAMEARFIARAPLHNRLDVESESFGTHNSVYSALRARALRGGITRLLVTARILQKNPREQTALTQLAADGAQIRRSDATEKCAVVGARAWIGSANASAAFAQPDQLDWGAQTKAVGVVVHERRCFDQRWTCARALDHTP